MKVVIAPDSYKGALRAEAVAQALAEGWSSVFPGDELCCIPLSDGGEGMASALAAACGGKIIRIPACDALMRPVETKAVMLGNTAILESAEANGIERLKRSELDPLAATTYGVGVMIKALLDRGCRDFVIGIGGSATVDGGAGMLQALGMEYFDIRNKMLPIGCGGGDLRHIHRVETGRFDPRLSECRIKVACDVTNGLCGRNGSAAVFGPQKGATPEMVQSLDENLAHWAGLFGSSGSSAGDGAAGGLGFALREILHGELVSGADLVMEYSGFESVVKNADLVITGEGCSDEQTAYGKLCSRVAEKAAKYGVPTLLVSGALRGDTAALEKVFCGCFSISPGAISLDEAIAGTQKNLIFTGANIARLVHISEK